MSRTWAAKRSACWDEKGRARSLCPGNSVTFKPMLYILVTLFPFSMLIKSRLIVCLPHRYAPQKGGSLLHFPSEGQDVLALGWTKRAQTILHSCEFSKKPTLTPLRDKPDDLFPSLHDAIGKWL